MVGFFWWKVARVLNPPQPSTRHTAQGLLTHGSASQAFIASITPWLYSRYKIRCLMTETAEFTQSHSPIAS